MGRNASGTYSLPAGNPVLPDTVITPTWANPTMEDLGAEITDSLSRDGKGSMRAELGIVDGTQSVPGLRFVSETGSGMFRASPGDWGLTVEGVEVLNLTAAGVAFPAGVATPLTINADIDDPAVTIIHQSNLESATTAGPQVRLYRNRAIPADGDTLGRIQFRGNTVGTGAATDAVMAFVGADLVTADNNTKVVSLLFNTSSPGSATRMIIKGSDVGINTLNPKGRLHIVSGAGSGAIPSTTTDDLIVDSDTTMGMNLIGPDVNLSFIYFGTPSANPGADLVWDFTGGLAYHRTRVAGGQLVFATDTATEAMRITANQEVIIGVTGSSGNSERLRVFTSGSDDPLVIFESQSDDSNVGPNLWLSRNRPGTNASNGDNIGSIDYRGKDSLGNQDLYSRIATIATLVTSGAEQGRITLSTRTGTSFLTRLNIQEGVYMQTAAQGDQGPGTINATGYFVNGVDLVQLTAPTGAVMAYAGTDTPAGWFFCNGQVVSRTTFAALFAVIGIIYGNGDGSTTFNVPDYRGYFLRAQTSGTAIDPDAAGRTDRGDGTGGDNVGSVQTDDFAAHTHTVADSAIANLPSGPNPIPCVEDPGAEVSGSAGGNETRPVNIYVRYYIKA